MSVNLFSEFGFFVAQHLNCLPAARVTQPKRSHSNRGGTSAPLEEVFGWFEVRVGSAIGKKRLSDSQRRSWTSPPKLGPAPAWRLAWMPVSEDATVGSKHWVVTAARAMDSGKAKQPVLPRFRSCLLNEHHIENMFEVPAPATPVVRPFT